MFMCNVGTLSLFLVEMHPKNSGGVVYLDGRGIQAFAGCGARLSEGGRAAKRGWAESNDIALRDVLPYSGVGTLG